MTNIHKNEKESNNNNNPDN